MSACAAVGAAVGMHPHTRPRAPQEATRQLHRTPPRGLGPSLSIPRCQRETLLAAAPPPRQAEDRLHAGAHRAPHSSPDCAVITSSRETDRYRYLPRFGKALGGAQPDANPGKTSGAVHDEDSVRPVGPMRRQKVADSLDQRGGKGARLELGLAQDQAFGALPAPSATVPVVPQVSIASKILPGPRGAFGSVVCITNQHDTAS